MRKDPVEATVIAIIAAIAAFFLVGAAVKCCGGLNIEYSSGSRSGVIQKLSKKGVIWQTWEGELNLGYNTASKDGDGNLAIAPAIFHFSVSNEDVAKALVAEEANGKRPTVEYKPYFLRGWDKGATSYDVTGIARRATE